MNFAASAIYRERFDLGESPVMEQLTGDARGSLGRELVEMREFWGGSIKLPSDACVKVANGVSGRDTKFTLVVNEDLILEIAKVGYARLVDYNPEGSFDFEVIRQIDPHELRERFRPREVA